MNAADRSYHKRQLVSAADELERVQEKLTLAVRELGEDDGYATQSSRSNLADALLFVKAGRGAVELALKQLPAREEVEGYARP